LSAPSFDQLLVRVVQADVRFVIIGGLALGSPLPHAFELARLRFHQEPNQSLELDRTQQDVAQLRAVRIPRMKSIAFDLP
jgi:hypothetical protein